MRLTRNVTPPLLIMAACGALASGSAAASPELELTNMGEKVPSHSIATGFNNTSFPGFKCEGIAGGFELFANPSRTLDFPFIGSRFAYSECVTNGGQQLEEEAFSSKLEGLKIGYGGTITETFAPTAKFNDYVTGCKWALLNLEGTLPASDYLEGIKVSGPLRRRAGSAKHCPETARARGTLTVKPFEEAPGRYLVEQVK